ncbi:hypothetical protein AIT98_004017 [Salmonella enterica subsp. indica]|uniref:Uncharacterized protein n=1 Tax=Salmonella enterica TaxID=28901 RepID=A0A701ZGN7_SALER|nr:hypothetical protein [Salmonella enterica]HAC6576426.1 hypothetical protein [Salmonella enterica subsp. indica]HBC0062638.1 hypothetical protein [Salmonella enterica]HCL5302466.1 hypothetical protein [Salmonella enterica]
MQKINIKVVTLGHIPASFDKNRILKWKSSYINIDKSIDDYSLTCDSDIEDWAFSDRLMSEQLPELKDHDFLIAITNVPLENNWYSRRLGNNRVLFTFHEIKSFLDYANIPLENAVLRVLYAYSMVYMKSNNTIPDYNSVIGFTHDETKGCLFDMNGIKTDLIESCASPIVCRDCEHKFHGKNIPLNLIQGIRKEIKKIKKPLYYRWVDFVKSHPIISLIVSMGSVIILGMVSSILSTLVYEHIVKNWFA